MIDPALFEKAYRTSYGRPGMGDLRIVRNPYECQWDVQISYCVEDGARYYRSSSHDVNEALTEVIRQVETFYPDNPSEFA